jgi:hypothetical protein
MKQQAFPTDSQATSNGWNITIFPCFHPSTRINHKAEEFGVF